MNNNQHIKITDKTSHEDTLYREEVQEVMGDIPRWITHRSAFLLLVVTIVLGFGSLFFEIPAYVKMRYIVKGGGAINIFSSHNGIIKYTNLKKNRVKKGDTVAVVSNNDKYTYYIAPSSGFCENNFLYTSGDWVENEDIISRIIPDETSPVKVFLCVPKEQMSKVSIGTEVLLYGSIDDNDFIKGRIVLISQIPDSSQIYLAEVNVSESKILSNGYAKVRLRTSTSAISKLFQSYTR